MGKQLLEVLLYMKGNLVLTAGTFGLTAIGEDYWCLTWLISD
jgi:hypothetical protein